MRNLYLVTSLFALLTTTLASPCQAMAPAVSQSNQRVKPTVSETVITVALGDNVDYWITYVDPFITVNTDNTYLIAYDALVESLGRTHPLVLERASQPDALDDPDVMTLTVICLGIQLYNDHVWSEAQSAGSDIAIADNIIERQAMFTRTRSWYIKVCFTGRDATTMIAGMRTASSASIPYLGRVPGYILNKLADLADRYRRQYGGFCLARAKYAFVVVWVSRL